MSDPMRRALPLRLAPYGDENLPGYALRLAHRNSIANARALLRAAGTKLMSTRSLAISTTGLDGLATITTVDEAVLNRMRYAHRDEASGAISWQVNGHPVDRDMLVILARRYCPVCLSEAAYHRAPWDLAAVEICPRHLVHLLDRCPLCHRLIGWAKTRIDRCACGGRLSLAPTVSANPSYAEGTAETYRLLGFDAAPPRLPERVTALGPGKAVRLMCSLGWFLVENRFESKPSRFVAVHRLDAGYRALVGFPHSFEDALARLRADRMGHGGDGVAADDLGPRFMRWALNLATVDGGDLIRGAAHGYLGKDGVLARLCRRAVV